MTTARIREDVPGWTVFTHPTPGGESAEQVAARADRVIARVLDEATDRALVFSHGHLLRVLAARWLDGPPALGQRLLLATGTRVGPRLGARGAGDPPLEHRRRRLNRTPGTRGDDRARRLNAIDRSWAPAVGSSVS